MLFVILILNHDGYIGKGKKKLIFDYYYCSNANVNVLLRTRVLIEDISLSRERTVDHDVPFFASLSLSRSRSSNSSPPSFHRMEKRVAAHCYRVCRLVIV